MDCGVDIHMNNWTEWMKGILPDQTEQLESLLLEASNQMNECQLDWVGWHPRHPLSESSHQIQVHVGTNGELQRAQTLRCATALWMNAILTEILRQFLLLCLFPYWLRGGAMRLCFRSYFSIRLQVVCLVQFEWTLIVMIIVCSIHTLSRVGLVWRDKDFNRIRKYHR